MTEQVTEEKPATSSQLDVTTLGAKPSVPLASVINQEPEEGEADEVSRTRWYAVYIGQDDGLVCLLEAERKFQIAQLIAEADSKIQELLFVFKGRKIDFKAVRKFVIT